MPLTMTPLVDPSPTQKDWFELRSGRCQVGTIRRVDLGFREPFWAFNIWALRQVTHIDSEGTAKTLERCFENAKRCWTDQIEAMGLKDAEA